MATVTEAKNEYQQLLEFLKSTERVDEAGPRAAGAITINGVRLTFTEVRKQRSAVKKRVAVLEKALSPVLEAEAAVTQAEDNLARSRTAQTYQSPEQLNADLVNAREQLKRVSSREVVLPKTAAGVSIGSPAVGAQPIATALTGPTAPTGPAAPTGPVAPTGPTAPTSPTVTTGGGKVPGKEKKGKQPKLPANWEAKFRELFPSQAWLLDVDPVKYPGLNKVLKDAYQGRMWETPEGQARFATQLDGTDFFKELASTQVVRQVKAAVGDLGFDTVPFNQFLTKAMNLGWQGETLKAEAYKEAFRKDDTGAYVNPTAVERVRKSNPYLQVANIGKAFFSTVSDDAVQQALTGGMTTDDVVRQQRELAKTRYAHLAPLLDQGLSLQDIGDTFRTTASQILEKDPNTIDMSQADYEVALNFGEPGQKRVMTNGEWERLLRTDKRYGWTKTENAKAEARQFVSNMVQVFGRVI